MLTGGIAAILVMVVLEVVEVVILVGFGGGECTVRWRRSRRGHCIRRRGMDKMADGLFLPLFDCLVRERERDCRVERENQDTAHLSCILSVAKSDFILSILG